MTFKTRITRVRGYTLAVLFILCGALGLSTAAGETIYLGDAAAQGQSVTAGGGTQADAVVVLTYILHAGSPSVYTAPSDQQLKITEVNFFAYLNGNLTPFLSRYNGGSTSLAASYEILTIGDAIEVTGAQGHLENRAFTVGGLNPTISVDSGDQIVAGWLQDNRIVYIGSGRNQGAPDYVRNGDSLSGATVGGSPTLNDSWDFDRVIQMNMGLEVVPEPATMSLLALGGIAMLRRRKK